LSYGKLECDRQSPNDKRACEGWLTDTLTHTHIRTPDGTHTQAPAIPIG